MFLAHFTGFSFLWRDNHFFILCYQTFVKIRSVSSYGGCLHLETAHWYSDQLTGTGGLMSRRNLTEKQWFPFCSCSQLIVFRKQNAFFTAWFGRRSFTKTGNLSSCGGGSMANRSRMWLSQIKKQRKYWLRKVQDHLIGTVFWLLLLTSNISVTRRWFCPGRTRERSIVSPRLN